ncbi:ead/Ea22-like family protein [Salmonella enterica]
MSNIDKQALLVSKAKASVFTMGYISQFEASDIDSDDIDLRFEVDGVETGTTVSIVDECGHAAQIITALLDELEHYKSREERVTKLVMDNSTSWDALYKKLEAAEKRIAELTDQKATWVTWAENASGMVDMLRLRIAELERSETQLINERDSAESALNDAYKAVMGQAPEWSNWFSFENAIDEIELVCELWRNQTDDIIQFRQRIQELEAKLETTDRLQDGAFRDGLKAGFSYGQTDDQSGFTQCMSAYNTTPASLLPDGLIRAVHFYEQVKRENPPVETGAWKDAIDWVLKEACLAASTLESSREHEAISQ